MYVYICICTFIYRERARYIYIYIYLLVLVNDENVHRVFAIEDALGMRGEYVGRILPEYPPAEVDRRRLVSHL